MAVAAPTVKGWCPGAYRPMLSGDGLILRIRPHCARLTRQQVAVICDLSNGFGNGLLDVTSRANLQIRGVAERDHMRVLDALAEHDLLDPTADLEQRRNILIDPFWAAGDLSFRIATRLMAALAGFPAMPAKAGFAIDCGKTPLLARASADIRFELADSGALVLRADGAAQGKVVTEDTAIEDALKLAQWFVDGLTQQKGRMRDQHVTRSLPAAWQHTQPRAEGPLPQPGKHPEGFLFALPFGKIAVHDLIKIAEQAPALRLTPWRIMLAEGVDHLAHPNIITTPDHRLLTVDACSGKPYCASAHIDTHRIARALAPHVTGQLHVSGCAKGCARQAAADIVVVGTAEGCDIIENGTSHSAPNKTKVAQSDLLAGNLSPDAIHLRD
ncbi:MAG: cobalamin biosynthesis protein CobG [Roseobacter sp.]